MGERYVYLFSIIVSLSNPLAVRFKLDPSFVDSEVQLRQDERRNETRFLHQVSKRHLHENHIFSGN